jgi:hypothetical protein
MGKKLSTFIGDSTYTRAPPNYRSPLRSNYCIVLYVIVTVAESIENGILPMKFSVAGI